MMRLQTERILVALFLADARVQGRSPCRGVWGVSPQIANNFAGREGGQDQLGFRGVLQQCGALVLRTE